MNRSYQMITASMLVAVCISLTWLNAPLLPTILGTVGTGLLVFLRNRRATGV